MALISLRIRSDVLGRTTRLNIVLPDGPKPEGGFAALYLLHGMSDDMSIWLRRSSIERYADEKNLAVVMPDGRLSWYVNAHQGERYFDYISNELPKICERLLPGLAQRREKRFIGGLSMGGYGALRCALGRPDVFSRAISLSGALDVEHLPGVEANDGYWTDIFGPKASFPGSENDLFALAEKLRENRPQIYLWCGREDFLYPAHLRMGAHLKKLNYVISVSEGPGGHSWDCWDREIQSALEWLPLAKEENACP